MSPDDAKRNLRGLGKLVARNASGPKDLKVGFMQTVYPVLRVWALIAFLLLFGEPICAWLTR